MSFIKQNRKFRQHQNRTIIKSQVENKILSSKGQLLVKSDTDNIKPNQTQQNKKMTSLVCTSTLQERKLTDKMTQTVSVIQQSNYKFLKEAVKQGILVLYSSKYESMELRYLLHIS